MTIHTIFPPSRREAPSPRRTVIRGAGLVPHTLSRLRQRWREQARIRRDLEAWRHLGDHLLRDIGVQRRGLLWLDGEALPSSHRVRRPRDW